MFRINGVVNNRNVKKWATDRPEEQNHVILNSSAVMTCSTVSKSCILGPYFFENKSVTAEACRKMIIHYASLKLRSLTKDDVVQHDGASHTVETNKSNGWTVSAQNIESEGLARFFRRHAFLIWPLPIFWGYIKSKIYTRPVECIEEHNGRLVLKWSESHQKLCKKSGILLNCV